MPPRRNWSELPELLLLLIIRRLPSLLDFFAFGSVCRSWRSLLRSSASLHYLSSRPPLLLNPLSNPNPRLQTIDPPVSHFKSLISPSLLCLGYSYGHLLLLHRHRHAITISDAITGAHVSPPPLPLPSPASRFPHYYAALTAPPSSASSILLLFYSQYHFLYLHLCGPHPRWLTRRLSPSVHVTRLLHFQSKRILAVNECASKLIEFQFDGELSVKVSSLKGICKGIIPALDRWHFGPQIVECGGELILVLLVKKKEGKRIVRIDVYRLDFERMAWVEVKGLGDYALFLDCGGKCPVACYKPEQWGGRSGCVYLAGPGCSSWRVFSLGEELVANSSNTSPLHSSHFSQPRWPSPIWVYPSLFF